MTVWETDSMPPNWRLPLRRALDVWMPCDFNVAVFERELGRPVLKLSHPVPPVPPVCADPAFLGLAPDEFVFYSIFEWQDRKGPVEQIDAFLRAFRASDRAVLLLKSTPKGEDCARSALGQSAGAPVRTPGCCSGASSGTRRRSLRSTRAATVTSPCIAARAGAIRCSKRHCAAHPPLPPRTRDRSIPRRVASPAGLVLGRPGRPTLRVLQPQHVVGGAGC